MPRTDRNRRASTGELKVPGELWQCRYYQYPATTSSRFQYSTGTGAERRHPASYNQDVPIGSLGRSGLASHTTQERWVWGNVCCSVLVCLEGTDKSPSGL